MNNEAFLERRSKIVQARVSLLETYPAHFQGGEIEYSATLTVIAEIERIIAETRALYAEVVASADESEEWNEQMGGILPYLFDCENWEAHAASMRASWNIKEKS